MSERIPNGSFLTAGAFAFAGIIAARSIQFITSLCMIAYLSPKEIGEYALAMFTLLSVFSFLTTGTDSRIIAVEDKKNYLPESWTIELLRGLIIFFVMIGIFIFFHSGEFNSKAFDYMLLLGLSMLIRCARNINMVTSRKKLNMLPIFYIELGSAICLLIASLLWVEVYKNGWALAVGYFVGSVTYTLLSFILLPSDECHIRFDSAKFREIFSYSKWIFYSAQVVSFFENIIPIFVTQMFGLKVLGLFEKSDLYSRKIIGQLNQIFWIVGLPWASKSFKKNISIYQLISLIMMPFVLLASSMLALISIFVPHLLLIVGGPSWSGSEDIVRAICFLSAVMSLNMPFGIVMQATKLPKYSFLAGIIKLATFLILFLLIEYENVEELIYTLALADLISTIFYFVIFYIKIDKRIGVLLFDTLILSIPYFLFHIYGFDFLSQLDGYTRGLFLFIFVVINFVIFVNFVVVKGINKDPFKNLTRLRK